MKAAREAWFEGQPDLDPARLVFLDETWTIGALNATALVAAIGDVATFARARDLAAWLGLVP